MRGQSLNERSPHPVLADLPVFTPSAELWPRIVAAQTKQRPPRRRWVAFAAAAAIAGAALLIVPRMQSGRMQTGPIGIEGQRESQALEHEWQTLAPSGAHATVTVARLQMIDAALQAAYDRGAEADELQPLWKQRNDALRGLILIARTDTVTRI